MLALLLAWCAVPAFADWRQSPVWDDGKAEYCAYEVSWSRYGNSYDGQALLVVVKEPWAPDLEVKADVPRPDGFDVLKVNHIRDVQTGIYAYHQMASIFIDRRSGSLRKLTAASTEACGVSTADIIAGELTTRSYFDGQGLRRQPYPAAALPEDGLPGFLREFVVGNAPAQLEVFPTLLEGRFPRLEAQSYDLTRRSAAGDDIELRLENRRGWMSYIFEKAEPHRLLSLERSDGTSYRRTKCDRLPYWQMSQPGQEAWWPENK
ncbi:MAG: hypothetical protein AAF604_08010 [Acidobacteriota bacterium]